MIQQWIKRTSRGTGKKQINATEQRSSLSKTITTPLSLSSTSSLLVLIFLYFLYFLLPSLTTFINAVKTQTKPESIRRSLSHHKRVLDTGYFWALWHLQNPLEWQNVEHLIHLYALHLCSFPWGCKQTTCLVWAALAGRNLNAFVKNLQIWVVDVQRACPFLFWIAGFVHTMFSFNVMP